MRRHGSFPAATSLKRLAACNAQQRGVSLLEFAIVGPLLFLVLFGLIFYSMYFSARGGAYTAAQRALSLASVIPELDADATQDIDGNGLMDRDEARAAVENRLQSLTTKLASGPVTITSSRLLLPDDGVDYIRPILPVPTRKDGLARYPMVVQVRATLHPTLFDNDILGALFSPLATSFEVRAIGYREPRFKSSFPAGYDCLGRPLGSASAPTATDCNCFTAVGYPQRSCAGNFQLIQAPDGCSCICRSPPWVPTGEVTPGVATCGCPPCPCPNMNQNPTTCACTAPGCPAGESFFNDTCSCRCPVPPSCSFPYVAQACACVCPAASCTAPFVPDAANNCNCICPLVCTHPKKTLNATACACDCIDTCVAPKVLAPLSANCDCICPPKPPKPPGAWTWDDATCTWICDQDGLAHEDAGSCVCNSNICPGAQVIGTDCHCACPTNPFTIGACTGSGGTWDSVNCSCTCPASKPVLNALGQCTCPAQACANPLKGWSSASCGCVCTNACPPGFTRDADTCACNCVKTCVAPKSQLDASACACKCPNVDCGPLKHQDPNDCQCKCNLPLPTCLGAQAVDPSTCECSCGSVSCTSPFVLDPLLCACVCPACPPLKELVNAATCECGFKAVG